MTSSVIFFVFQFCFSINRLCIIFFSIVRIFESNLTAKDIHSNPTDGSHLSDFLVNLEQHQKALSLIGCLPLPFDSVTIMMIIRFAASAIGKILNFALINCASWRLHRLPISLVEFTACSYSRFKLAF